MPTALPLRSAGDKVAVQLVDDARDESEIESRGHGAEARAGRGNGIELRLVGRQRRNRDLARAHLDDLRVQALFFERFSVFGNKDESRALIETGEDEDDLLQRRCRYGKFGVQQAENDQYDAKPSVNPSLVEREAGPSPCDACIH
jgi:hypothetical protein